jgi:hypothetical protein
MPLAAAGQLSEQDLKILVSLAASFNEQTPEDVPKANVDPATLIEDLMEVMSPSEMDQLEQLLSEMENGGEGDPGLESFLNAVAGESTDEANSAGLASSLFSNLGDDENGEEALELFLQSDHRPTPQWKSSIQKCLMTFRQPSFVPKVVHLSR